MIQATLIHVLTELDFLLGASDHTRTGALRFVDENGRIQSSDPPAVPRVHSLVDLRKLNQQFESRDGDVRLAARQLRGTGDSLGGARPKSALYDGKTLALAKYSSLMDDLPIVRMEVMTLGLAKTVGLRTSTARLELADTSHSVAVVHRFDRVGARRVPYISVRSFIDHRDDHSPVYYTDIADVMRGHCGNGEQVRVELEELFRRVLFTILVLNSDDHLKNHGFLWTQPGRWSLSPAFDINPDPFERHHLETGISELSGMQASIQAAIDVAPRFEITESQASLLAFDMAASVHDSWRQRCEAVGMDAGEIESYTAAFEHSEMQCALALNTVRVSIP